MEETKLNPTATKKPASLKQVWQYNKALDRALVVLQTLFILTFSYRSNDVVWGLFVMVMFLCFFSLPIIYLSKFVKEVQLNAKFEELSAQGKIPAWIPKRRTRMYFVWFFAGNPVFWIFFSVVSLSIASFIPWFMGIIFLLPWMYAEYKDRKEFSYIEKFVT